MLLFCEGGSRRPSRSAAPIRPGREIGGGVCRTQDPGGRHKPAIRKPGRVGSPANPVLVCWGGTRDPKIPIYPCPASSRMRVRGLRSVWRGLKGWPLPMDSAPSTRGPKFRLMVPISNSGASRFSLAGTRITPHFQSFCCVIFRRWPGAGLALVQAVAEPLHQR